MTEAQENRLKKEFPPPEHAWKVWVIGIVVVIIISNLL